MVASTTARGRLRLSLRLRPSPTTTAATTTVSLLLSLPLLEDTPLLVATSPTLLALSTLPRGRLRLRPSPTTTAATAMDSDTEDTVLVATAATDTADASTAKLLNPPASGRDQPGLVTQCRVWLVHVHVI